MKPTASWRTLRACVSCVLFSALYGLLSLTAGCGKSAPVAVKSAKSGGAKLTPAEVESRIRDLQANKTIPESVKPEIIQTIRAQGQ